MKIHYVVHFQKYSISKVNELKGKYFLGKFIDSFSKDNFSGEPTGSVLQVSSNHYYHMVKLITQTFSILHCSSEEAVLRIVRFEFNYHLFNQVFVHEKKKLQIDETPE